MSGNRQKITESDLPFHRQKQEWGEWVFNHRVGICVTVIVYMFFGIVVLTAKIIIQDRSMVGVMMIAVDQLPPEPVEPPEPKETELTREFDNVDYSSVRNLRSNANAREEDGTRQSNDSRLSDLYNQANAISDRLQSTRQNYQAGLDEEEAINNASRNSSKPGSNDNASDARVKSNVTIEYSLGNRENVYMKNPAYRCEGGATVVVDITVNRNGRVIDASVSKASSASSCFAEMALDAAQSSRFNVDASAPEKEKGTITYIFIPQR